MFLRHLTLAVVVAVVGTFALASFPQPAEAASPDIVISQVYGGGGNAGATFTHDFIELFNRGGSSASLAGWSVQYASATGTGNLGATTAQLTPLPSVSLAPGQYLLVQEAQGAGGTAPLPTADVTDSTPINMSGTGGKVALVNTTTPLGCNGGSTPCSVAQLAQIVDLVGWDGANFSEGSPAPATTSTTAVLRALNGCTDTDDNATDFTAGAPNPRNTASPLSVCPVTTNPSAVGSAAPAQVVPGGSTLLTVVVTPGSNPTSTGLSVTADLTAIGGLAAQAFFDDGSNGDATSGDSVYSYQATVTASTTTGAKSLPVTVADAQSRIGNTAVALAVIPPLTPIHTIQGSTHISPLANAFVRTSGIVIAKKTNGFYLQDPLPDADRTSSEGLFVFTSAAPATNVGDAVEVTGTVKEFRAGGAGSTNLTITEIDNPGRTVTVLSTGNPLPAPTVIGTGGWAPPATVIEDDTTSDVEVNNASFDPAQDGLDFYESLESMLVRLNDAVAVGPTNGFGEIAVVGDNGVFAGLRTPRGGIIIRPGDFNPERIILDDTLAAVPLVNTGDTFPGSLVGVVDYSFGNFKLNVLTTPTAASGGLTQETTAPPTAHQLAVATFNVENLSPTDPPAKFATLANLIVGNLKAPDLVAIEEIQDNNGITNNGVVDAATTWGLLITAIQAAGGPAYQYRQIDPVDNQDGGAPGGNIRQGFLFRTDRGLSFIDRPGAGSTTANAVTGSGGTTALQFSPGRIDPLNTAFSTSRKPLAGEFLFKGDKVFVVANHFNSKGGDQPLFGRFQPPFLSSEAQRLLQAAAVNGFVASILASDPNANVVVLGDFNDFQFSSPIATLKGGLLVDLIDTLPESERYTYVFDGNSQTLDHILVGNPTYDRPFAYDVVHVNSEFAVQASDHEPQVAQVCVDATPPALAVSVSPKTLWPPNHKYVKVAATVVKSDNADPGPALSLVSVASNEPDNGLGDGDTADDIVIDGTFSFRLRAERSGSGTGRDYTVTYRATDACGNGRLASATVTVPRSLGG